MDDTDTIRVMEKRFNVLAGGIMKKRKRVVLFLSFIVILAGCGSLQHVRISKSQDIHDHKIKTIVLARGGPLADAVSVELLNYGYTVMDSGKLSNIIGRYNANEIEVAITEPQNLNQLSSANIDAILFIRTVMGYDNKPQSASIKLISTANGQVLLGGGWENGSHGAQGSIADAGRRTDLVGAARTIGRAIGESLISKKR